MTEAAQGGEGKYWMAIIDPTDDPEVFWICSICKCEFYRDTVNGRAATFGPKVRGEAVPVHWGYKPYEGRWYLRAHPNMQAGTIRRVFDGSNRRVWSKDVCATTGRRTDYILTWEAQG